MTAQQPVHHFVGRAGHLTILLVRLHPLPDHLEVLPRDGRVVLGRAWAVWDGERRFMRSGYDSRPEGARAPFEPDCAEIGLIT